MSKRLKFVMAIVLVPVLAAPQKAPRVRPSGPSAIGRKTAATSIKSFSVSPATVTFNATDPDLGTFSDSTTAVAFSTKSGNTGNTWTVTVQAPSATLTSCPLVPISKITATCTSVSVVNSNGGAIATGACSAAAALSTTPVTVASGSEDNGAGATPDIVTINITFTLSDSWKYIAATSPSCSTTLTYTLNAP